MYSYLCMHIVKIGTVSEMPTRIFPRAARMNCRIVLYRGEGHDSQDCFCAPKSLTRRGRKWVHGPVHAPWIAIVGPYLQGQSRQSCLHRTALLWTHHINPFISIRNKLLEICPQRVMLPIQSGTTARCKLMAVWRTFWKIELVVLKIKKKTSRLLQSAEAAPPDQITQQNSLQRELRAQEAVKALYKGLVAVCHSFWFIFLIFVHSFDHIHTIHSSIMIRRGP